MAQWLLGTKLGWESQQELAATSLFIPLLLFLLLLGAASLCTGPGLSQGGGDGAGAFIRPWGDPAVAGRSEQLPSAVRFGGIHFLSCHRCLVGHSEDAKLWESKTATAPALPALVIARF